MRKKLIIALIFLLLPVTVLAQVPKIRDVPEVLPSEQKDDLNRQRSLVVAKRKAFLEKLELHNQKCGSVTEGTPLDEECKSSKPQIEAEKGEYIEAVSKFNEAVDSAVALYRKKLEARIKELKKEISVDEQAIRNLGLEKRAEDFEQWAELSREAQREYEKQVAALCLEIVRGSVINTPLSGAKAASKSIGSFTPPQANSLITWLKSLGVNDPYLFDGIRNVAYTSGKPEMAGNLNKLLDRLGQAIDLATTHQNLNEEQANKAEEYLEALTTVLGFIDPEIRLLVADLKFTTAAIYTSYANNVSKNQINSLTLLTEEELTSLKRLSSLMEKHINELKIAKQELAALSGDN